MADKNISIECSKVIKNILCEALRNYAHFSEEVKMQPNADEIKKQALNLASHIEQQFNGNNPLISFSTDYEELIRQAINYHYDRINHLLDANLLEQRKLMLNLLNGAPTLDHELDIALIKDKII